MTLAPLFEAIPPALREGRRFVVWKLETRDGKTTKVPYAVGAGQNARSNDPTTWASFDEAWGRMGAGGYDGIGIMLAGGGITCVDLDHCIFDGVIETWALQIVAEVDSYTEISQSGEGLHIFVFGTPPKGRRRKGTVEMYGPDDNRFIAITGHFRQASGYGTRELRHVDLAALHGKLFPHAGDDRAALIPSAPACVHTDAEVLAAVCEHNDKARRLFQGEHGQTSEERESLLCILAWYTRDEDQLYRLATDAGFDRADDERKLRNHDIPAALDFVTDGYTWPEPGIGRITKSAGDDDRPHVVATPEPEFPFDALPAALRALAEEGAASTGAAAEAIAVHGLAVLATALGGSAIIRVGSWSQRPILWTATVARPGTAKSTALRIAKRPLDDYDAEMHETWLAERKIDKMAVWKRALADNVTVEKLGRLLIDNPRGLLIAQDELAGLIKGLNQYKGGKGNDRQSYLALWSGAPLRVDRVTADPLFLFEPILSITGSLQPAMLASLQGEDGMTGRWLVAYLENRPREIPTDDEINGAGAAWKRLIDGLLMRRGCVEHRLSAAGYKRYRTLRDAEIVASRDETDADFADWLGKIESHLVRLVLLLWAAENTSAVIHEGVVDRAYRLTRYFADGAKGHIQTRAPDPSLPGWDGLSQAADETHEWFARHPGKTWRDADQAHTGKVRVGRAKLKERYKLLYP